MFNSGKVLTLLCVSSLALACAFVFTQSAGAGTFGVSPLRLEMSGAVRTGLITVTNNGDDMMRFQVEASAWTQDKQGRDTYSRTTDLHYYPRILEIKPGQAGVKIPAVKKEKTYRIFIRELPKKDDPSGAAKVTVYMRFGVPVFVKPPNIVNSGELSDISLEGGDLSMRVKNSGNVHFKIGTIGIRGLSADGAPVFSNTINGWYILEGASRIYNTTVQPELCAGTSTLNILVDTDQDDFSGSLKVDESKCRE
ncbi:hypothetical protein LCGC14_2871750 [marine sediment metagenome]|uniref:Pili assembly chaperone N-terminal domain-containing protein n=1 Tax=marine sediment metagenome TaxID=412755 RepID=A0A0F8YPG3_9ZZZZ